MGCSCRHHRDRGVWLGCLAGSYAGAHARKLSEMSEDERKNVEPGSSAGARRAAVAVFTANALQQLPNFATMISWHMSHRVWLPVLIIALEAGALFGAYALRKVENAMEQPKHRRRIRP